MTEDWVYLSSNNSDHCAVRAKSDVEPWIKFKLLDMTVNIPAMYENVLEQCYGQGWRVPERRGIKKARPHLCYLTADP